MMTPMEIKKAINSRSADDARCKKYLIKFSDNYFCSPGWLNVVEIHNPAKISVELNPTSNNEL